MKKWFLYILMAVPLVGASQSVGIGEPVPIARLEIRGSTSGASTSSLTVKNASNQVALNVRDNGFTGLGVDDPLVRLHISSDFETVRIRGNNSYISFYDQTNAYKGYLWQKAGIAIELGSSAGSNIPVIIAPNNTPQVTVKDGFTGFGTTNPSYRVDILGRMRIKHFAETAGIWFDNSLSSSPASFVGMYDNSIVGFYGTDGAVWPVLGHTLTGNVGIGSVPNSSRLTVRSPGVAMDVGGLGAGSTALRISSGRLQVEGAGISSPTAAFVHKATNANSPLSAGYTVIDHPFCNGNPAAILMVTMNGTYGTGLSPGYEMMPESFSGSGTGCQVLSPTAWLVFYNGPNNSLYAAAPAYARDKWCIRVYSGCFVAGPVNFNFNVMIVNN
jgi:hypothetical protein